MKKIIITEEQNNRLKMPKFIYKAIATKSTSLGDNPAFPQYGEFGMEYDLIKGKYCEIDDKVNILVEKGILPSKDLDAASSVLSKTITKCQKIEEPLRPQLLKLCENIVNKALCVPPETLILKTRIVNRVISKKPMRVLPEGENSDNSFSFEDIDELDMVNKAILKRRFINSLIQGFAYKLSNEIDEWKETIDGLNGELWELYGIIEILSNYILFNKKEEISEKNPSQQSYVEVHLGKKRNKTIIEAQGIIFPFLLKETFRGMFELFSSHGLPEDNKKAMYIIRKADFIVAEPWDIRIGMCIVESLSNVFNKQYNVELISKTNELPFFFSELCSMPFDDFNDTVRNFLVGTRKGNDIASDMENRIIHDIEYDAFKDTISQKNIETSLIADDCFTSEELGDYVIKENNTQEEKGFHGTNKWFNKFNHKKYLNTGAGSQTFGWGTYITDDYAVAKGYADNSKVVDGDTEDLLVDILMNDYKLDYKQAMQHASDIMSNIHWAGSVSEFLESCKRTIEAEHDRKSIFSMWYDVVSKLPMQDTYIYEVDIPDNNGSNYIQWYEPLTDEMYYRIFKTLFSLKGDIVKWLLNRNQKLKSDFGGYFNFNDKEQLAKVMSTDNAAKLRFFDVTTSNKIEGKNVYHRLEDIFNSPKAASLFLMQCGFDGITYPTGTRYTKPEGARDDGRNYVIFDAKNVRITKRNDNE